MIDELHRPTVGILGCAQTDGLPDPGAGAVLTGEMNPDEATLAAGWLRVNHVIASHFIYLRPEVDGLVRRVPIYDTREGGEPFMLRAGEVLAIEPGQRRWPVGHLG